jgi:hypothetical protein
LPVRDEKNSLNFFTGFVNKVKERNKLKRNRGYFREQRRKAIQRKFQIQKKRFGREYANEIYDDRKKGQLAKGKIHCSCPMCRTKSYDELSHRDKVKELQVKYQLTHYLEE